MNKDDLARLIPDEVVEAAHKMLWYDGGGYDVLPDHIRAAIAAGLAAWPGAQHLPAHPQLDRLILPLPQEPHHDR